jgi:membrane fusion protein (multidrug efflux system)
MSAPDKDTGTENSPGAFQQIWNDRRRRLPLLLAGPILIVLIAAYFYITGGRYADTDDSYVKADKTEISADVAGRVVSIEVGDNQAVVKGQVLFRLDDRPYRIALEHAQAQLAAARFQVEGYRAMYLQRQADVKAAEDNLDYRQREFDRQQVLLKSQVTTQAKLDEAKNALDSARQAVAANQQQRANVLSNLNNDPDLPTEQHPLVKQAQAQVDQATLDLSHTVVSAPSAGTVTKVTNLPVGEYLNASVTAFALISTENVWVEANFKETDLTHMLPGDKATITVDTYPGHSFQAHVASIGAGTGAEFSVLPPQNATGNWVKVVQRLPVRLAIESPDAERPLRAGMSADVTVDTGYSRIFGWTKPTAAEQQKAATPQPPPAPPPAAPAAVSSVVSPADAAQPEAAESSAK